MSLPIITICLVCKDLAGGEDPIVGQYPVKYWQADTGLVQPTNWPTETQPDGKLIITDLQLPPMGPIGPQPNIYVQICVPDKPLCEPIDPVSTPYAFSTGVQGGVPLYLLCIPTQGPYPPVTVIYKYQLLICVREDTLVNTVRGEVPIAQLQANDRVIDARGIARPLSSVVESGKTCDFVRIKKGAFGPAAPKMDLYIKRGHPILLDGKEVPCEALIDGHFVDEIHLDKPARIFTLATQSRNFVDMQGIMVGTWSEISLQYQ